MPLKYLFNCLFKFRRRVVKNRHPFSSARWRCPRLIFQSFSQFLVELLIWQLSPSGHLTRSLHMFCIFPFISNNLEQTWGRVLPCSVQHSYRSEFPFGQPRCPVTSMSCTGRGLCYSCFSQWEITAVRLDCHQPRSPRWAGTPRNLVRSCGFLKWLGRPFCGKRSSTCDNHVVAVEQLHEPNIVDRA